eukprot:CAMPEP_0174887494 /NCGR_PEP_ID=MMETSP0167-20121228/2727_1 /TAXON_ID=38298 /ORGANISM="Rhodella maculata, Strain CCMP736" /LENGTH=98 /DNA_ID=CAMNT_0016123979 /DNA_START=68 /DNA_END=361 /DNA_ORIENTATION=+
MTSGPPRRFWGCWTHASEWYATGSSGRSGGPSIVPTYRFPGDGQRCPDKVKDLRTEGLQEPALTSFPRHLAAPPRAARGSPRQPRHQLATPPRAAHCP